ncbi:MAG: high-potential iron-sulfur protein [Pseudomonadota bacterium]|nr:high-potential iron-sulfur protein [Pseudomonadota bacterium]
MPSSESTPPPRATNPAPAMSDASAPGASGPGISDASTPRPSAGIALVTPQDPAAIALGYVAVASSVDAGKYTKYAPGQNCGNCALYQGKAGDAEGPCPLFGGRHVLAAGWCSAHVSKV